MGRKDRSNHKSSQPMTQAEQDQEFSTSLVSTSQNLCQLRQSCKTWYDHSTSAQPVVMSSAPVAIAITHNCAMNPVSSTQKKVSNHERTTRCSTASS